MGLELELLEFDKSSRSSNNDWCPGFGLGRLLWGQKWNFDFLRIKQI